MCAQVEREHIRRAVEVHQRVIGRRPVGIYQGKPNVRTRQLVVEEGGFLYDADSYADDLPYWTHGHGRCGHACAAKCAPRLTVGAPCSPHLVVPYTLDNNDMRFAQSLEGDRFYRYLVDAFEALYAEGEAGSPKMMSIGLHCRIVGK